MTFQPYPRRRRILVRTAYVLLCSGAIRRRTFAAIIKSVMGEYRGDAGDALDWARDRQVISLTKAQADELFKRHE